MSEISIITGNFPEYRGRRLRASEAMRRLVRETRLSADQLVMPYFVREGRNIREAIDPMPGQFRFSTDALLMELESLQESGVNAILLFGIPGQKDSQGSGAVSSLGIIPQTVREIKKRFPGLLIMTDVCLCAYTDHGHCGLLNSRGEIENDPSLKNISQMALIHAEAGADIVAPSDMMDGRVSAIRKKLDEKGFFNTAIMSYSAKYASAFYGPFRDAAHCAPSSGDRKTYQMDGANIQEALREMAMDIQEGADILMVKPALAYLDVIHEAAKKFPYPVAAFSVSGEYAMIKAAAEKGMLDEKQAVLETTISMIRAGAKILITYHARQIANYLQIKT